MSFTSPSLPPSRHHQALVLPKVRPESELDRKVQEMLGGSFEPSGAQGEVVQGLLDGGFRTMATKAEELRDVLEKRGFDVRCDYCRSSSQGHAVPVLTIRSQEGRYGLPSSNLWWNPVIPRESSSGGQQSSSKQVFDAEDVGQEDSVRENSVRKDSVREDPRVLISTVLHVELFSKDAPVRVLLLQSDSPDSPIEMLPVFSKAALREAREHAAANIISGDGGTYSFAFHEVILPKVRERIREETVLFGERDTPSFCDDGTRSDGVSFRLIARYDDDRSELQMEGGIVDAPRVSQDEHCGDPSDRLRISWRSF